LAAQTADAELKAKFGTVAVALEQKEARIVAELNGAQGKPVDIGGYYHPSAAACAQAMRPSITFNKVIDRI
jgi:isocitrate dehydrogenase